MGHAQTAAAPEVNAADDNARVAKVVDLLDGLELRNDEVGMDVDCDAR